MVKHKCHQMFAVSSPSASIPLSVHIIYFIPVIYLVVSGWMKPCAPDCCSMREPSWTCGVQRRSMAIQSWIGGALSLCWSLRQAYCCRHIRPTTSQQRTTKLVLLRTFGVCSSTMTNARKTSRRSVVNVCCNCTGATTKGRTGRTCGDTSNCFLRVAITWT